MEGLYFLAPTLLAILISMLFVRAGAIALMMTGMHYEQAKFQALSAFTSTGFTTREAEKVVNHPTRRKIISTLMIGGYAGIAAVLVSGTSSLAAASSASELPRTVFLLALGLIVIYLIGRYTGLMPQWENFVEGYLRHRFEFEYASVEELLHLAEGYGLVRLEIGADSPFLGRQIVQIGKTRRDTLIIGVERGRSWLAARQMKDELKPGDQLVIYGLIGRLKAEYQDKEAAEAEKAEIEKAAAEEAAVEKAAAEKAAAEKAAAEKAAAEKAAAEKAAAEKAAAEKAAAEKAAAEKAAAEKAAAEKAAAEKAAAEKAAAEKAAAKKAASKKSAAKKVAAKKVEKAESS